MFVEISTQPNRKARLTLRTYVRRMPVPFQENRLNHRSSGIHVVVWSWSQYCGGQSRLRRRAACLLLARTLNGPAWTVHPIEWSCWHALGRSTEVHWGEAQYSGERSTLGRSTVGRSTTSLRSTVASVEWNGRINNRSLYKNPTDPTDCQGNSFYRVKFTKGYFWQNPCSVAYFNIWYVPQVGYFCQLILHDPYQGSRKSHCQQLEDICKYILSHFFLQIQTTILVLC